MLEQNMLFRCPINAIEPHSRARLLDMCINFVTLILAGVVALHKFPNFGVVSSIRRWYFDVYASEIG